VPLPAAALVFGSGLFGLVGALRRKLSLTEVLFQGLIGLNRLVAAAILPLRGGLSPNP
jgi:hypothetical protein